MSDPKRLGDQELEPLFQALNSPLTDSDFVDEVMRRVRRHTRVRRFTLASATTIGVAISAEPFVHLGSWLGARLVFAGMHWPEFMRPIEVQILAVMILCAVSLPSALRWLSK